MCSDIISRTAFWCRRWKNARRDLTNLTRFDDEAAAIRPSDDLVAIELASGGSISARLVVGADGRHSLCREAAGITVQRRELHQAALTFNVSHSRPHQNISTEFHTPQGPCVFVPLPGNRSSVVWVSEPKEADRLMALSDEELSDAAEVALAFDPGQDAGRARTKSVSACDRTARGSLPSTRIALVGEAAHVLPPIGAQGLNMGLRDAADIAEIVRNALAAGEDPGSLFGVKPLCVRAAPRRHEPYVRHRYGQPLVVERIPADAVASRRRSASDRLVRTAAPARHA